MPSSAGKRQRERQKIEKAQAKAERRAARQAADSADSAPEDGSPLRTQSELVDDRGALHRAFEAGEVSQEDFEERRERIQAEFGQLS
jgi:hypothetical protein